MTDERDALLIERAAAHSTADRLRSAQRWQSSVSDYEVAQVFLALEHGYVVRRGAGRWATAYRLEMTTNRLQAAVDEMLRTALAREARTEHGWRLIPALVHYRVRPEHYPAHTACLYMGEGLGAMRVRLVDRLDLVDCLECEAAIARGGHRGL